MDTISTSGIRRRVSCKRTPPQTATDRDAAVEQELDWTHPCIPSSIRRPWQVWLDENEGCESQQTGQPRIAESTVECASSDARTGFDVLQPVERAQFVAIALMELAAFCAWLLAQAPGLGGRGSGGAVQRFSSVIRDVRLRPGLWDEVERAWDSLGSDGKADWLVADHADLLKSISAWTAFSALPASDGCGQGVPVPETALPIERTPNKSVKRELGADAGTPKHCRRPKQDSSHNHLPDEEEQRRHDPNTAALAKSRWSTEAESAARLELPRRRVRVKSTPNVL